MTSNQKGYVHLNFTDMFIGFIIFGVAIGVLITLGVPILWEWIKPFIHALTA